MFKLSTLATALCVAEVDAWAQQSFLPSLESRENDKELGVKQLVEHKNMIETLNEKQAQKEAEKYVAFLHHLDQVTKSQDFAEFQDHVDTLEEIPEHLLDEEKSATLAAKSETLEWFDAHKLSEELQSHPLSSESAVQNDLSRVSSLLDRNRSTPRDEDAAGQQARVIRSRRNNIPRSNDLSKSRTVVSKDRDIQRDGSFLPTLEEMGGGPNNASFRRGRGPSSSQALQSRTVVSRSQQIQRPNKDLAIVEERPQVTIETQTNSENQTEVFVSQKADEEVPIMWIVGGSITLVGIIIMVLMCVKKGGKSSAAQLEDIQAEAQDPQAESVRQLESDQVSNVYQSQRSNQAQPGEDQSQAV